ncbi:DUF7338 family protein [Sutterella wadsworthensis]|uniref:DUF7338 family protein n=1 Tax=Sutterella wadsworthensis TaxID=40545 RepID=UPI00241D596A|nr:hypothetical protein [Sutterella wadsworthensis]
MGELMLYVKWICLLPLSFVMAVVGRVLAPILPFFAKSDGYLPSWLSWFQTPDNPLDGDKGHWERWPGVSAWATYRRRVAWLLRNVCYGFDISVLGQKTKPGDWLDMDGQEGVSDQPYGKSGYWLKRVYRGEKLACWHLYVIRQWSLLPSKCLRISMGWKLFSFDGLKEETHQLTCYCNPLKTFKQ